jgi:5-formyltetrahydrofolate cyclo-ligase
MEAKRLLRSRLLSVRAARSATDRVAAGQLIAAHASAAWQGLGTVAAYAAVDTEPPTRTLLDALRQAGAQVLLPIVVGDELDWAGYDGWERLVVSSYGLLEPAGPRLGPAALAGADLVVVPALAVDVAGHRLGRGRGFYDRALAGTGTTTVAVVFDDELIDEVPAEAHDVPMAAVLRPGGLLRL